MTRRKYPVWIIAVTATVALAGCGLGEPTATPESSFAESTAAEPPVTLASGSFTADLGSWGQAFDIEATGTGDDVSGTMEVSSAEGTWSVDLQCARTTDDGLLLIGGAVTESTHEITSEGVYVAILLAPGTPVRTLLWFDVLPTDDDPSPADSCPAFLENMFSDPEFSELTVESLVPIEGDLELGP
jgi:hypothetical protein